MATITIGRRQLCEKDKIKMIDIILSKNTFDMDIIKENRIGDILLCYEQLLQVENKSKLDGFIKWLDDGTGRTGEPEIIAIFRYYFRNNPKLLKCYTCGKEFPFCSQVDFSFSSLNRYHNNAIISVPIGYGKSILEMLEKSNSGICFGCCRLSDGNELCHYCSPCRLVESECTLRIGPDSVSSTSERVFALMNGHFVNSFKL